MRRIIIIGGGISGLGTAFHLQRSAAQRGIKVEVTLLEKGLAPGGKARTCREDGYTCEEGPNGFLTNKPWTVDLCKSLGIEDSLLYSTDASRRRFIFSEKKLHRVPMTPVQFFTSNLLSIPGRARIIFEPFSRRAPGTDESIHDFGTRRIGGEAARKILNPMVSGVFAGATEALSLKSCFPRMKELEDNYGGLLLALIALGKERRKARRAAKEAGEDITQAGPGGPGGVLTCFKDGLSKLVESLAGKLGKSLHTGKKVTAVDFDERRRVYNVSIEGGKTLKADAVVIAAPAFAASEIVSGLNASLASVMNEIPYSGCMVVGLGFRREHCRHDLNAFGFLMPSRERRDILGCLFSSSLFANRAPDGRVLMRVFMGGYRRPEMLDWSNEKVISTALFELNRILGFRGKPEYARVFKWHKAIPQYTVGHSDRLERIDEQMEKHPGLFLTGNAYRGVSINDCTLDSVLTSDKVLEFLLR